MLAFFDNDVIYKLAALDLFEEMLTVMDINQSEVRVLSTAKYFFKIKDSDRGGERFGSDVWERVKSIIDSSASHEEAMNINDEDALTEVMNIDDGEAELASAASRTPDALLLSGDKRFIEALASIDQCAEIAEKLKGRVVCLERLLIEIIRKYEFDLVKSRALECLSVDGTLRTAFHVQAPEESTIEALKGYEPKGGSLLWVRLPELR